MNTYLPKIFELLLSHIESHWQLPSVFLAIELCDKRHKFDFNLRTDATGCSECFFFENWKFLACCYLIIWYLNQMIKERCGNRSFLNCIIFQTSLFCLYLRKIVNNFFTHTQKRISLENFKPFFEKFYDFLTLNVMVKPLITLRWLCLT